jgi:hypothetical protein
MNEQATKQGYETKQNRRINQTCDCLAEMQFSALIT